MNTDAKDIARGYQARSASATLLQRVPSCPLQVGKATAASTKVSLRHEIVAKAADGGTRTL